MIVFDTNVVAQNATTQYLNFNFNSMVKFGQRFMCAGDGGLLQLEGTSEIFPSDDGVYTTTECYFEPVTTDLGISNQKRLRAVYIGYESNTDITLRISTELTEQQSYTLPATTSGNHARKITISRALKGRYWTFQIFGSGAVFAIDHIQVLPVVRGRGFDQN